MSGRSKKDYTPPPPLLLMPAGGGLTFIPPDHPNILMPVVQSAPALLKPEVEAERDYFVGHSQAQSRTSPLHADYIQSSGTVGHESFTHAGQPPSSLIPIFAPSQFGSRVGNETSPHSAALLSSAKHPPLTNPSVSSNMYRHQGGRPQYASPPTGSQSSVPVLSPFDSANSQPPTAMMSPLTSSTIPNTPPNGSVQPHLIDGNINMQTSQNSPGQYTGGLYYQPIRHHWCYQQNQGDVEVWRTFSVLDSMHLEMAFNTRLKESPDCTVILTNGGRHDVNVGQRLRTPVYWTDDSVTVRRCSWFYKRDSDHRYIPYTEDLALQIENEYRKAMETGGWQRRLEFPGEVAIVMNNANDIVQLPTSSSQEKWGNMQGEKMQPRVVKRGVENFATIEHGEREEVDHLVFVVPGVEDTYSNKGMSIEALVDDLRSNAMALLNSHFTQAFQSKSLNRVEFLPVMWTQALQDGTTGLKTQMENITLQSASKLRHLINNLLENSLFYTSPVFSQKICDTVGSEMNRMFHVFLERNKSFSGDVSVAGHSLETSRDVTLNSGEQKSLEQSSEQNVESDACDVSEELSQMEEEVQNETEITLESLLSKIGLQDKVSLFQQEQIDVDSLVMCSEQDLKDIGLPMGPRKKLLGFLMEEKMEKDTKAKEQTERKIREELEQQSRESRTAVDATNGECISQHDDQHFSAKYIPSNFGAGQLKINYPQLDFTPSTLFALGSPIAGFLSLRGVQDLGELFQLPTCPKVFNIFHPFDPVAYRLEPLIRPNAAILKPVQVPHYKGRKRLHLEFKEAVTRYGTDIKQKIVDSFKSTWNTIHEYTRAYRADAKSNTLENDVQSEMNQMMSHIAQQHSDDDVASVSSLAEEEIHMGHLNDGQRIDYVLQEGPLESFNDYLFALASHTCYWESEDTALMLLKEIYSPLGFRPVMPGADGTKSLRDSSLPPRHPPPPITSVVDTSSSFSPASSFQTPGSTSSSYQTSATFQPAATSYQGLQSSYGVPLSSQTSVGPPPPMFSPQAQSQGIHGLRRSPYVAPDFANLPSSQNQGGTGPPPMGHALPQGYRKGQH